MTGAPSHLAAAAELRRLVRERFEQHRGQRRRSPQTVAWLPAPVGQLVERYLQAAAAALPELPAHQAGQLALEAFLDPESAVDVPVLLACAAGAAAAVHHELLIVETARVAPVRPVASAGCACRLTSRSSSTTSQWPVRR